MSVSAAEVASPPERPGTQGIWTFVFLDMVVFGLMFLVYVSERMRVPTVFAAAQRQLDPWVGLASTLFLVTSSWCMVESVHAIRAGTVRRAGSFLTLTMLSGLLFVANKVVEYSVKIGHGLSPETNSFFTFYFVITGIHFLHVVGGLIFMASLRLRLARQARRPAFITNAENLGLFWHFVDVLWLFIFPLLYLTGVP